MGGDDLSNPGVSGLDLRRQQPLNAGVKRFHGLSISFATLTTLAASGLACEPEGETVSPQESVSATSPEAPAVEKVAYPSARRSDHRDDYFGTAVADPYRWMEDIDDPEVRT